MSTISPMKVVRKFSRRRSSERLGDTLAIGDRFEQADRALSVWVVERISTPGASRYPLVSLAREDRPDLKKTVSLAVLEDGEDFRPAALVAHPETGLGAGETQAAAH